MKPKTQLKVIALSVLILAQTFPAYAETEPMPTSVLPDVKVNAKRMDDDEVGKNRQFSRETVNLYKGRKEVETYKGNTVSDLLNGLPGVYSGDSRNSGAIDPNIRGQQGQGRIPVTIDGTEQSIVIWRGYAGANNRNYVDPNLISSVYVAKGPSFERGVPSGIGGSVALKTIDVDDVVPKGKKFGMELKLEGANNSIAPRGSKYEQYIGKDYRTTPDPLAAGGGMWRVMFDGSDRVPQRFGGRNKMFTDNAARLAVGTRQENFDLILAYAYRDKGNYYSGKKGAKHYGYVGHLDAEKLKQLNDHAPAYLRDPDAAPVGLFYYPGGEVTNSSLNTRSWLGKATFRLPEKQTIKLGWRHTQTKFGEIMPSHIFGPINAGELGVVSLVPEWSLATVKQQAYNVDYAWKPENNRWIDLNASLWTTRTYSVTNSAGGTPGDVLWTDPEFDKKYSDYKNWANMPEDVRKQLTALGLTQPPKPTSDDWKAENIDGRLNTIAGEKYYAQNNRFGFNLSNRMKLHDRVELTLMGDVQYEKLQAHNNFEKYTETETYEKWMKDDTVSRNWSLDNIGVPRNGRRREYNFGFNFKIDPTDRLTITAGARYGNYRLEDDYFDKAIRAGSKDEATKDEGKEYELSRVASPEEYAIWQKADAYTFGRVTGKTYMDLTDEEKAISNQFSMRDGVLIGGTKKYYWYKDEYGRYQDADNPLLNGTINIHEKARNPAYDPNDPNSGPEMIDKYQVLDRTKIQGKKLSETDKAAARKRKDHGWVPMFSITYRLTDYARIYARYTETLRFPSIFEGTQGFSSSSTLGFKMKPEHGKNWEFGYIHDLTGFFPKMRHADLRLNYFHNKTKNIIDRDEDLSLQQFEKQTRTGLELSARWDTGKFFGSMGVVRNLKNKMCDAGYVHSIWLYNIDELKNIDKRPVCTNGSVNAGGYLAHMIQPRWAIDAELGGRFFDNKLETGVRMHYHSRIHQRDRPYGQKGAWGWYNVTVWDAYARYRLNEHLSTEIVGSNLTNRYYLDPFTRSYMPAPGRTIRLGVTAKF